MVDLAALETAARDFTASLPVAETLAIVFDAATGVDTHTRRIATVAMLFGVRRVALVVNKMDLVDYDEAQFEQIADSDEGARL